MKSLLLVFLGGGLGAVSRFGLSSLISAKFETVFPWATFIVNVIGCFLIGIVFDVLERELIDSDFRLALMTGFLGGFTTFSTFGLETLKLLEARDTLQGIAYPLLSNFAGVAAVFAGILVSGALFKRA